MSYQEVTNVYDFIQIIRPRVGMYIGEAKMTNLRCFLDGYHTAEHVNDIRNNEFPPFDYFHRWCAKKCLKQSSSQGWDSIILRKTKNDETIAMELFFTLIDEFKEIQPIAIKKIKLNPEQIAFHLSDKCGTYQIVGMDNEREPIYKKPTEVFHIQFSHDFGYTYMVIDTSQSKQNLGRPDFNQKDIDSHLKAMFGDLKEWEPITGNLKTTLLNILNLRY